MDKRMDFLARGEKFLPKLLLATLPLLLSHGAMAAIPVWNNAGTDWGTLTNWTPNDVPDSVDDIATFNSAVTNQPTINGTFTFGGIDFQAGAGSYNITVDGGQTNIDNFGIINNSGVTQQITLGATGTLYLDGGDIGAITIDNTAARNIVLTNNIGDMSQVTLLNEGNLYLFASIESNRINIGSVSGGGNIRLYGQTLTLGALGFDDTISGIIYQTTGISDLIKEGAGTLTLTQNSEHGGATIINDGTLHLGNGGSTGQVYNTSHIIDDSHLVFDNGTGWSVDSDIRGSGDITKQSAGLLRLRRNVSVDGGIQVNGGILEISDIGHVTSDINLAAGTRLDFSPTIVDMVYDGVISGDGGVRKSANSATIILTGNNTYTGLTTLPENILNFQIGNGGPTGSIVGDVYMGAGAHLIFDRTGTLTYNSVIDGTGVLDIRGGLNLVFTNDQTYTGTTVLDKDSTLRIGSGGATGSVQSTIFSDGTVIFDRSTDLTYEQSVRGVGNIIKRGAGTLILNHNANSAALTTIEQGTIQIGDGGAGGFLAAKIVNNGALIFDTTLDMNVSDGIEGSGTFIKRNDNFLNLFGDIRYEGDTFVEGGRLIIGINAYPTELHSDVVHVSSGAILQFNADGITRFDGKITGDGEVWRTGSVRHTTILTGENDYTGPTRILSGNIQIGDGGESGSIISDVDIASGYRLIFDRSNDVEYPGVLTGEGRLIKRGAGTLTLSGNSTDTNGLIDIEQGAVQVGNGTTGSYASHIFLRTEEATAIINTGSANQTAPRVDGVGQFIKEGSGELTVVDLLRPSRTLINEGTLRIGDGDPDNGSLRGRVVNNSALVFDQSGNYTFPDLISGTGSVTQAGRGELRFSANNTYTGDTIIESQSALRIDGAVAGNIVNNGELRLRPFYFDMIVAGEISGTGSLEHLGGGDVILTNDNNSYSGGTIVRGNALQLGNGGETGNIVGDVNLQFTNAQLLFNHSNDVEFNGIIRGDGEVSQIGSGTVSLNGVNSYTGATRVLNGTLLVGGTEANSDARVGRTVVESGGTVGGFGTIAGDLVNFGTVAPGASHGTLTVLGNYIQDSGATYVVDIHGTESDVLNVSGTASLSGNIRFVVDPVEGFVFGQNYSIINASTISGTFSNVDGLGQFEQNFLTGQISYDTENNQVLLTPGFNEAAFNLATKTPNQKAVADYLLRTGGTAASQALVGDAVSGSDFRHTMNQLSAANYANQELQLAQTARWFQSQLSDRMDFYIDSESYEKNRFWITPYGSSASIENTRDVGGLDTSMGGAALGAEFPICHSGKLGVALNATYFDSDVSGSENVSDNGMLYEAGLYGTYQYQGWLFGASIEGGGASNVDATRTIGSSSVDGNYGATIFSQQIKASYNFDIKDAAHIRPFAGLINQNISRDSFNETGLDGANTLSVQDENFDSLRSEIGLATEAALGKSLTFLGSVAWLHEFSDDQADVTAQLIGSTNPDDSFTVHGTAIGRELAVIKAGLVLVHKDKINVTALYEGVFADSYSENGGKLQLDFDLS